MNNIMIYGERPTEEKMRDRLQRDGLAGAILVPVVTWRTSVRSRTLRRYQVRAWAVELPEPLALGEKYRIYSLSMRGLIEGWQYMKDVEVDEHDSSIS